MSKRIYDYLKINDLKDMLNKTGILYADRPAYKIKVEEGKYQIYTHKEVRDMINNLGTALINLGLKGKRIAVIGENRYEWEIAYLSIVCGTEIVVPLDKSLPANELELLIERSDIEAIFYTKKYSDIIQNIKYSEKNKLKHLISMDSDENFEGIYSQKELIREGRKLIEEGNNEFLKENWDYVGNEIGKFIEVAFRIVQNKTLNQYTSMNEKLPIINEGFLKNFEQSNNADEEYRIIIPRVLYSMYCIRNKRGMIHINNINPNRMDALYLINSSKWILAEIIRTTSNIDFEIAMQLIDDILHKTIPYVWRNNDTVRVLNTKLNVKEKILLLLYSEDKMSLEKLFNCIEYKNKTIFKKYIITF